jgi:hypothetical protein
MNITEHRKNYFHLDGVYSVQPKLDSDKETVEEFIARGKTVQMIPMGVSGFKTYKQKAKDDKARRNQGVKFPCKNQHQGD